HAPATLTQRLDIVEHPESAAVRRCDDVVIVYGDVADRRRGHVLAQRLPRVAVVGREPHLRLAAGEEQAAMFRIFANGIDRRAVGDAANYVVPALAAIARAVNVRMEFVETDRVDGRIR